MTFAPNVDLPGETGEGGVVAEESDDIESKLAVDEHDDSFRAETGGLVEDFDTFVWQL